MMQSSLVNAGDGEEMRIARVLQTTSTFQPHTPVELACLCCYWSLRTTFYHVDTHTKNKHTSLAFAASRNIHIHKMFIFHFQWQLTQ